MNCKLLQWDLGQIPSRKQIRAVRKPLVQSILKCMFYITWSEKLDQTSAEWCSDTP